MKNKQQVKTLIERAGGTLEEDEGTSDMRIFQAVAPQGKVWAGSDLQCLVVMWARGNSDQAYRLNEDAFADLTDRLSFGLRDMTPAELEEHADD